MIQVVLMKIKNITVKRVLKNIKRQYIYSSTEEVVLVFGRNNAGLNKLPSFVPQTSDFKLERYLRLQQEAGCADIRKGAGVSEGGLTKWRELTAARSDVTKQFYIAGKRCYC
jgi:Zn-dependent M28 family amino/carboxypeptidase